MRRLLTQYLLCLGLCALMACNPSFPDLEPMDTAIVTHSSTSEYGTDNGTDSQTPTLPTDATPADNNDTETQDDLTPTDESTNGSDTESASVAEPDTGKTTDPINVNACTNNHRPEEREDWIADFESGTIQAGNQTDVYHGFFSYNDGTAGATMIPADVDPGTAPSTTDIDACSDGIMCVKNTAGLFTTTGAGVGLDWTENTAAKDLSAYKGIAFYALLRGSTTGIRVSFPDRNTHTKGGVCDDNQVGSECNNNWSGAILLSDKNSWTRHEILFENLSISTAWGHQPDAFVKEQVYGIRFEIGENINFDFCLDDIYFIPKDPDPINVPEGQLLGDPCANETPWICDPVTNKGCAGDDEACAWGTNADDIWGFYCYDDSTERKGDTCGNGAYCGPRLVCTKTTEEVNYTCKTMCCDDSDCDVNEHCVPFKENEMDAYQYVTGDEFGVCILSN